MAVVPTFPLFNLPYVPLEEVISYMDPIDLFWFSMLSKKTKKLAKEKHILDLDIIGPKLDWKYQIVCKNQNGSKFLTNVVEMISKKDLYQSEMLSRNLCDVIVPTKFESDSIITFWKDVFEGFKKMTLLLCNSFKIRNVSIEFYVTNEGALREIIEHTQKLQSKYNIILRKLKMMTNFHSGNMYKSILEKFKDVPELIMDARLIEYHHNIDETNVERYLKVIYADWLTFKDVNLIMKCKTIKLWDLRWTSQEMNQFLKKWIESSMMENAELTMKNVDIQTVVKGLQVTPQRKNISFLELELEMKDCFEIHRNDGVNANIWSYEEDLIMQTYQ